MTEVGSRVFAIRNVEDTTVYAFGAGVYAGDFIRPGATPPTPGTPEYQMYHDVIFGPRSREFRDSIAKMLDTDLANGTITQEQYDENKRRGAEADAAEAAMTEEERVHEFWADCEKNPRIDLDNGKTTWGMECWWGDEATTKAKFPEGDYTYVYVDSIL